MVGKKIKSTNKIIKIIPQLLICDPKVKKIYTNSLIHYLIWQFYYKVKRIFYY